MKKVLSIFIAGIILLVGLTGCQNGKAEKISKPDVTMKTVTQNSKEDLVSFEFQIPENWICDSMYELSVGACPEDAVSLKIDDAMDAYPYLLEIGNYYNGAKPTDEQKLIYENLFTGDAEYYKKQLNQSPTNLQTNDSNNFFDPLVPQDNNEQEFSDTTEYIKDFQVKHYNGANGKITEVQYSFEYNNKKYRTTECYRQDIPYKVIGFFDDSLELSSGDIALWAASTLKVTENFNTEA